MHKVSWRYYNNRNLTLTMQNFKQNKTILNKDCKKRQCVNYAWYVYMFTNCNKQ